MCLFKLSKFRPKGFGYKVFLVNSNNRAYGIYYGGIYHLGKSYIANSKRIEINSGEHYMSGFHVFQNLKEAKEYSEVCQARYNFHRIKVVKIRYPLESVLAVGLDCPYKKPMSKVIVTKKMTIEKILN